MAEHRTSLVRDHLNHCVEAYAPIDIDFAEPIGRDLYEQMRADLMLCVGMLMALTTMLDEEPGK